MFGKIKDKLGRLVGSGPPFDPGTLGDPVAEKTQWTPLKSGGTSFRTHRLVATADRLEFRITAVALFFTALFFLVGLTMIVGFGSSIVSRRPPSWQAQDLGALLGLALAAAGIFLYRSYSRPVVFDRRSGFYWKGRTRPEDIPNRETLKDVCCLEKIHALQILAELCRGNKSTYWSYELNLVLKDGRRLNVVDHGSLPAVKTDGRACAEFLGVPLWDASRR